LARSAAAPRRSRGTAPTKALHATDRAVSGGAIDPTAASAIVRVAARHGDARLFDALFAAAERATDPDEHYRSLYALTDFRDPSLIDRGLELATAPQMRTQDTALYLAQFFANPDARARALSFVVDRWPALQPKVTVFGGDTTLVHAMGSFCDAGSADRIRAFFAAHPLPAAARTLEQTLEEIANCAALREKQTPVVAQWLPARP